MYPPLGQSPPFAPPGDSAWCFERAEAPTEDRIRWVGCAPSQRLTRAAFVDGSATQRELENVRSAGWAIAQPDTCENVVAAAHGVVPLALGPSQAARDGEEFAFRVLGLRFEEPLRVFNGCKEPIGCAISNIQHFALAPTSPRRHLWE